MLQLMCLYVCLYNFDESMVSIFNDPPWNRATDLFPLMVFRKTLNSI